MNRNFKRLESVNFESKWRKINKLSTKEETLVADCRVQDYVGFAHVEEITKPWWKINFSFHNWIRPRQRMQKTRVCFSLIAFFYF